MERRGGHTKNFKFYSEMGSFCRILNMICTLNRQPFWCIEKRLCYLRKVGSRSIIAVIQGNIIVSLTRVGSNGHSAYMLQIKQ